MSGEQPPIYRLHPLFPLRRLLISNSIIGFLLSLLVTVAPPVPYVQPVWPISTIVMLASTGLSVLDLAIFQHKHRESQVGESRCTATAICCQCHFPIILLCSNALHKSAQTEKRQTSPYSREEPTIWPVKWIMIADFLIFLILSWIWCVEMYCIAQWEYSFGGALIVETYVTILVLLGIILHFLCWWKAFRAREKQRWSMEAVITTTEAGTNTAMCNQSPCEGPHQPVPFHPTPQATSSANTVQQHSRDAQDAVYSRFRQGKATVDCTLNTTGQDGAHEDERRPLLSGKSQILNRHLIASTSGHACLSHCYHSCHHYVCKEDIQAPHPSNDRDFNVLSQNYKNTAEPCDSNHPNINPTVGNRPFSTDTADLVTLETPRTPGEFSETELSAVAEDTSKRRLGRK